MGRAVSPGKAGQVPRDVDLRLVGSSLSSEQFVAHKKKFVC
jgi:hypothetical protein